jgi:hypothetical protein
MTVLQSQDSAAKRARACQAVLVRTSCLQQAPASQAPRCSVLAGRGEHRVAAGRSADLLLEHVPVLGDAASLTRQMSTPTMGLGPSGHPQMAISAW